jgi:subtilisin family serine protease
MFPHRSDRARQCKAGMSHSSTAAALRALVAALLASITLVAAMPPAGAQTSTPPASSSPASSPASSGTVGAPAPAAPSGSASTPATAPASSGPAAAPASGSTEKATLLVKLVPGASADQAQAVVERGGGTNRGSVGPLGLLVVDVPSDKAAEHSKRYQADSQVKWVETDGKRKAAGAPSDPSYPSQWALPKIGWDTARDSVTPSGSATIAVLDTGVNVSAAELTGRSVAGWSAFGTDPASDPNGHGTQLASIAAAQTDNAAGIAGVAYAGAKVMPVQVLGADGTGQDSDVIEGVVKAADAGAHVILMGFSNPGFSQSLQDAIDYAWSKGAVLVAATGNAGSSEPTYPAGDAKVVGVSATDQNDALWLSSNHGADTFLGAPGVGILASGGASVTGTSASAAVVAGTAALLKAKDPSASNGTIVGRLARNADPAGTAAQTGNGRVNVARALGDSSTAEVVPAGAAPLGSGGPFVGPYEAAGTNQFAEGWANKAASWKVSVQVA